MQGNTVVVDESINSPTFQFARRFNVAVPFIDRHLAEGGRATRVAIRSTGEDISFASLAERVAKCGNALLRLGLAPRSRLLMVVKDCPEFFYVFWGAIKARVVPVPLNTMLRVDDYKFMIEDSYCAAIVYSMEFAEQVETAVASASAPTSARALNRNRRWCEHPYKNGGVTRHAYRRVGECK